MENKGVSLRWFNDACYEIRLPGGKTILTDPYIDSSRNHTLTAEDVEGADYILVSHTHFDHIVELGQIAEKFRSKIFVGASAGLELAKHFDLPGWQMYACSPGDRYELEDFTLECFRGKHTFLGDIDRPSKWPENNARDGIDSALQTLNMLGSYEYSLWLLTLPDHTRLLIWGGAVLPETVNQARHFHPTISIAQYVMQGPEAMEGLYRAIGGQVIFPHHHEPVLAKEGGLEEMKAVAARMAERGTMVVLPEKGRWYTIRTRVELAD